MSVRGSLALSVVLLAFCLGSSILPTHAFSGGQRAMIVIGQKDFTSYQPATSQNGLSYPTGVAFDPSGNLWVADDHNHRVLEFKPPFSDGMSAATVIGQQSFTKSDSPLSPSGFGPEGSFGAAAVVFDPSGNLWVTVTGGRVYEFVPPFSTGMGATLEIGQKDFATPYVGKLQAELSIPRGAVFDVSGDLWVVDSGNNRILEFKPPFSSGMNASLVLGQKSFETNRPSLSQSGLSCGYCSLAIDSAGNLWVGDSVNDRILEFQPPFVSGMNASFVVGQNDFVTTSSTDFSGVYDFRFQGLGYAGGGLAFDRAGDLWATYYNRVLEFKPPFHSGMDVGQASLEIGQPNLTSKALDDLGRGNWTGGSKGLFQPGYPAFDLAGNIWVPDSNNNRILEFLASSTVSVQTSNNSSGPGMPQILAVGAAAMVAVAGVAGVLLRRRRIIRGTSSPSIQSNE